MLLRFAWIFGIISTQEYDSRMRRRQYGSEAIAGTHNALERLDRSLLEERVAVVLFLIALMIFTCTFLHSLTVD
jgi:hypothetical protein